LLLELNIEDSFVETYVMNELEKMMISFFSLMILIVGAGGATDLGCLNMFKPRLVRGEIQ
jgi:ATP-dependent Clp protease ATP-binding subunit ClpA